MSVSSFIHVNKAENKDFDLEKFNAEPRKSFARCKSQMCKGDFGAFAINIDTEG